MISMETTTRQFSAYSNMSVNPRQRLHLKFSNDFHIISDYCLGNWYLSKFRGFPPNILREKTQKPAVHIYEAHKIPSIGKEKVEMPYL
jgi:hypothetical protein